MAIPSNKIEQLLFDLIEACRSGEAFTNTKNKFYGKVEERIMDTSDFYHPELDSKPSALFDSATWYLDQVRVGEISENNYKKKYESIRSRGILESGWAVLDNEPNSRWTGRVLDSVTRIVLARTCEASGHVDSSIPVPLYVVIDADLIRLIMKNKKSFQTMANDHPPADASSSDDIKKLIRALVAEEPLPAKQHSKGFKTKLTDHVHRMVSTNKTRATVRNYVSEVYNTIEQSTNGVKGFLEPKARANSVRKALEAGKGGFKIDASKWTDNKKEYTHEDYRVYQGSPTQGVLIKDFGREIERKAGGEDTRPSVYVFRTDAKTPARVREAQIAVFDKINSMHKYLGKRIFDKVYALGQITNVDAGKLLSETDVRAAEKKLKVINAK
tara:strand:+ start:2909 stop:4063 length:1155 start_codon:yes stop_codon:yes gene_type:complete